MTENQRSCSISVFLPAYNDAESIAPLISEALAILPKLTDDYEVIVVNDGSTDTTGVVLDELSRTWSYLKVINHARNKGYGGALRTGFDNASKELLFYTDGDGQYDMSELLALHPLLTSQVDVVNGYKVKRADGGIRELLGTAYNRLARLLFSIPIRDVDCDFRLMRKSALAKIELTSSSGAICVEMIHKLQRAGCNFIETPVHHYPRLYGRSQFFTLKRVARTVFDLLSLWLQLVVWPNLLFVGGLRTGQALGAPVGETNRPEMNILNNEP